MKTKEQKIKELEEALPYFTGTETWWKLPNPIFQGFSYTDGVRFVAKTAECYWLIEDIFIHASMDEALENQNFQVWKLILKVSDEHPEGAMLYVEDGNNNLLQSYPIDQTDFPLDEFTMWLVGTVLLLPSEY